MVSGLLVASTSFAQFVKIEVIGTINYLAGRAINPTVTIGSQIKFGATLDERSPSYSNSAQFGYELYPLFDVNFSFGNIHASGTTQLSFQSDNGFGGGDGYYWGGYSDHFGQGAGIFMRFPLDTLNDTKLPLIEDFENKFISGGMTASESDFLMGSKYNYFAQARIDSISVTQFSPVPEPATYGIAASLLLGAGVLFKRRVSRHQTLAAQESEPNTSGLDS